MTKRQRLARLRRILRAILWVPIVAAAACAPGKFYTVEDCRCARLCSERFAPDSIGMAIDHAVASVLRCRCARPTPSPVWRKIDRLLGAPESATLTERTNDGSPLVVDPKECQPWDGSRR